jgi:hypothetical protein
MKFVIDGDFLDTEKQTVFGRKTTTHWKPVWLVDAANVRLYPYLVVHR